jgi:hypothetical protein
VQQHQRRLPTFARGQQEERVHAHATARHEQLLVAGRMLRVGNRVGDGGVSDWRNIRGDRSGEEAQEKHRGESAHGPPSAGHVAEYSHVEGVSGR